MSSPWMQSKYTDKAIVCAICGDWISQGEARKFNIGSKVSAHDACVGARIMGDHVGGDPSKPVPMPPPKESPERDPVVERIERMHKENIDVNTALVEAVRSLKGAVVEQTMMLVAALKTSEVPK